MQHPPGYSSDLDLQQWRRHKRRERMRVGSIAVTVLLALALTAAWATRGPRVPPAQDGAVLPGGAVVAYSPGYRISFFGIERLHPFDIGKMDTIAERLVQAGLVPEGGFAVPEEAPLSLLRQVHSPEYIDSLTDRDVLGQALEVRPPAFASPKLIDARVLAPFRRSVGGTVVAARAALQHGLGVNLGGGFHHARPDMGHGFCLYNDVAVALHVLRQEGFTGRVLIFDTDAHQGDGDHAFFSSDPMVYSLSLHQGDIFPTPKLKGDLDVPLKAGTSNAVLLSVVKDAWDHALAEFKPDLVVHVAGSDILGDDPLAQLSATPDGLVARDLLVLGLAREQRVPLLHLLAGGYGPSSADAQARSVGSMLEMVRAEYSESH